MGATRKTIKKVLGKKFDDFVSSIQDEELRKLVRRDAFITGGSIVSLLLAENIKDFDLYLKTKETAKKLAEYYVKEFKDTHPEFDDGDIFVYDSDEDKRNDWNGKQRPNPALVKVFVRSRGIAGDANEELQKEERTEDEEPLQERKTEPEAGVLMYRPVFLSANAITLSDKIQIVLRFYGEPDEVHKNYDFIHCTCFWEAHNNKLTLPAEALESILAKTLSYQGSLYPICSVIRTRKFLRRGWHLSAGQYLKMCFQISDLDLDDVDVLEEQLTGVDQAYFAQIIKICREKKKQDVDFRITSAYVCEVIDRIFG